MRCFNVLIGSWFSLNALVLSAQCPDRTILYNKIDKLESASLTPQQQLKELLPFTLQLQNCPQRNDSVRAFLLQRVGSLYYLEHDFNNAILFTNQAVDVIRQKNNTYTNPSFLVQVYSNLQIFYDSLQRVKDRMNAIDSSIHFALKINAVSKDVLYMLWQRVNYSFDIGDYQRCLDYAAIGEALTARYGSAADSLVYNITFFSNRMNALIELKRFDEAESELLEKISGFKKKNEEKQCGAFYIQLATIGIKKNKYEQALTQFQNSFRCNKANNYLMGCKQSLNNIGYFYFIQLNDPQKALKYYREALKYKSDIQQERFLDVIESAYITGNIANAYVRMGIFDSAFLYFRKAFDLLGKGSSENTLLELPMDELIRNPRMQYIIILIREKADAYFAQFLISKNDDALNEAVRIYKIADRVLTKMKMSQSELQSMLAWRSNARSIYEHAIKACHAGNKTEDAFYFFEKSRAVLLHDEIDQNRRMDNEDFKKQALLNNRLLLLNARLDSTPSGSGEFTDIQKTIFAITQEKDHLLSRFRAGERMLYDSSFLSLQQFIKKDITGNGILLELFSGDSTVYIILITNKKAILSLINKKRYDALTDAYASYISDPILLNADFDGFTRTANELYKIIFKDIALPSGKIIVSPDGRYFPFEALVTNIRNKRKPVYLIEERPVSYTYSAQYLLLNFEEQNEESSLLLLGMAPVEFPAGLNLAALHGSVESLDRLMSNFITSHSLVTSAATKNEFLNQFYKYRIVQLYTHASESGKSGEPVIYFADSALYLTDLIPVKEPSTRLIILSACETGRGKNYQGEGIFSFNRAFAAAGIPSSMVNLWSVDNQSTYLLTELFYKYLSKGLSFEVSLQKAKIEFLKSADKERSLPYYWAATILAGQTGSVQDPDSFSWPVFISIMIILAVFFLFIKKTVQIPRLRPG